MRIARFAIAWFPALAWIGVIFYLSAQSQPLNRHPAPLLTYVAHFGEYALLAALLMWAQLSTGAWNGQLRPALMATFVFCALYAASDELHQSFVPDRDASVGDWATDMVGTVFALAATARWARSPRWRRGRYRRTAPPADPTRGRP